MCAHKSAGLTWHLMQSLFLTDCRPSPLKAIWCRHHFPLHSCHTHGHGCGWQQSRIMVYHKQFHGDAGFHMLQATYRIVSMSISLSLECFLHCLCSLYSDLVVCICYSEERTRSVRCRCTCREGCEKGRRNMQTEHQQMITCCVGEGPARVV